MLRVITNRSDPYLWDRPVYSSRVARADGGAWTYRVAHWVNFNTVLTIPDLTEGTEYEIGVNLLTRQSFDLFRAGNTGGPRTLIEIGTYDSKWLDDLIGNGMSRGQVVTTTTNNAPVFDETSFSFTALENETQ